MLVVTAAARGSALFSGVVPQMEGLDFSCEYFICLAVVVLLDGLLGSAVDGVLKLKVTDRGSKDGQVQRRDGKALDHTISLIIVIFLFYFLFHNTLVRLARAMVLVASPHSPLPQGWA